MARKRNSSKKSSLGISKPIIVKSVDTASKLKEPLLKKLADSTSNRALGTSFIKFCLADTFFQLFPDYDNGKLSKKCEKELPKLREKLNHSNKSFQLFIGSFLTLYGFKETSTFFKSHISTEIQIPTAENRSKSDAATIDLIYQQKGLCKVEERIGYVFLDRSLLLKINSVYRRLDFLGDAILEYLVARYLSDYSPKLTHSKIRSLCLKFTTNSTFADLAVKYDLHKNIPYGVDRVKSGSKNCQKCYADIFESLVGAIYLDSGMDLEIVWKVFYKLMKDSGCFAELESPSKCVTQ
uniref:RNase III domain-containing protein n=1 Tax=Panagrolaimus sp. ES5 TaxID=591445 RepID=A0AC34F8D2_9BILA